MSDFCVWNRCNNNCLMCTNPPEFKNKKESLLYSRQNLLSRVESWKEEGLGMDNINLTGGEPTIHPDFLFLLRKIRKILPKNKIIIVSNGRMFSYSEFAKDCLKTKNLCLEIALHGPNAKLHDKVTCVKGSFDQTVKGLNNILKYRNSSQELEIRIIITKLTYKNLGETVNFAKKRFPGVDRIILIFMEMEGMAKKNFKLVGLKYKEFKPYIDLKKIGEWRNGLKEIRLYHFPLCVLEPELWQYAWRTLRGEEVTFLPSCRQCRYRKYCLGIHKDYLKLVGDKEFRPIKKKIGLKTQKFFHHPIIGISKL